MCRNRDRFTSDHFQVFNRNFKRNDPRNFKFLSNFNHTIIKTLQTFQEKKCYYLQAKIRTQKNSGNINS